MTTRIVFEQREKQEIAVKEDCLLSTLSLPSTHEKLNLGKRQTERAVGTDVDSKEVGVGPSVLMVNSATTYEFQKLDATRLHRATTDPKLAAFLREVMPLVEDELARSSLQRQLTANTPSEDTKDIV